MTAKAVRQDTMLRWLWISLVVVFLDQITKWMAEAQIDYTTTIAKFDGVAREVIKTADYIPVFPHLNWTFAYNYGAAFNMFGGTARFLIDTCRSSQYCHSSLDEETKEYRKVDGNWFSFCTWWCTG